MTREEAIVILENERPHCGRRITFTEEEKCEAFDMAIEALTRMGYVQETVNCILNTCKSNQYIADIAMRNAAKFVQNAVDGSCPDFEEIPTEKPCADCRNCKKWDECECGRKGHENGTSIGYSVGECRDYEPCEDCEVGNPCLYCKHEFEDVQPCEMREPTEQERKSVDNYVKSISKPTGNNFFFSLARMR